jgi:isocitrate/isopropylmalate dehydrogenase
MKTYHLAVIPADGIGPEVIGAGPTVLDRLARRHGGIAFRMPSRGGGVTARILYPSIAPPGTPPPMHSR